MYFSGKRLVVVENEAWYDSPTFSFCVLSYSDLFSSAMMGRSRRGGRIRAHERGTNDTNAILDTSLP